MSLSAHGKTTSAVEVTNISSHGFWLLAHDDELFLPYDEFPWFKDQPVKVMTNVTQPSPGHFYWPDVDVDLTKEMIENPKRFPNVSKRP